MYNILKDINMRPEPFSYYTAEELWTDEHTARQMLKYHLMEDLDISSRNHKFINRSSEWMVREFKLTSGKSVADFGCGPGLYTIRLAKSGASVTGIDFSANSLKYAQKEADNLNLKIDYAQTNYLNYKSDKKFDLIIMIMCDFCVLSPDQRNILLKNLRKHLKPDGKILLDFYTHTAFNNRIESAGYEENQLNGFWSAEHYYGFVNTFKYPEEKVVLDKYTIIQKSGSKTVYNWLQYYSQAEIAVVLNKNGFTVEKWFNNVAGDKLTEDVNENALVAKLTI